MYEKRRFYQMISLGAGALFTTMTLSDTLCTYPWSRDATFWPRRITSWKRNWKSCTNTLRWFGRRSRPFRSWRRRSLFFHIPCPQSYISARSIHISTHLHLIFKVISWNQLHFFLLFLALLILDYHCALYQFFYFFKALSSVYLSRLKYHAFLCKL